ncbi:MAG: TonB-dependent receptor [Syntrophaceae bacterium]|nr:TonB-dependent receptor [Syntrophaceae bacterium]
MKHFISAFSVLSLVVLFPFCLLAQEKEVTLEEVVVTATRVETPIEQVASSTTVISSDDVERKKRSTVLELLRDVPGVDVRQSGGPGHLTDIFIRGSKSEHTLVMIDGVEVNDPISPGRSFDFAHLTVDNIERIEVIRGPQSTLYGSDAMGGVINIITKKGEGKPKAFLSTEAGSFATFRESAGVRGGDKLVNYSLAISRFDTEGISAANKKDGNYERDGYENTSLSTRLGFTPKENLNIDFILRYTDAKADLDNSGGAGGDDPNYVQRSKQFFFKTQAGLSLFDQIWDQKLGFAVNQHDRDTVNRKDPEHPFDFERGSYDGQFLKVDWQHTLQLHKTNRLVTGFEYEKEEGKSRYYSESAFGPYSSPFPKKTADIRGYYIQDQVNLWDRLFGTVGIRIDDHSRFGTETTYRIAPAYLIKETETKIKGTFGTGFKAPSLYQLFAPSYGDKNLKPEKSEGWDFGVEQELFEKTVILGTTFFRSHFEDLIDYDPATSKYINIGRAETEGVEAFASLRPIDDLTLGVNYTHTDTEDKRTGRDLLRRAKNRLNLDLNYRFLKEGNVNLGVMYVGKRDDWKPYPVRGKLGGYTLVNLAASYQITRNLQAFGRIDNLFDKDYEEVSGYGTPGLSLFGGLKFSF